MFFEILLKKWREDTDREEILAKCMYDKGL